MPITRAYNKAASLFPPISNLVINGGFDIWQRGTSFTALSKTFTADRWWKFRGGDASGGTWSRQTSGTSAPGTQYCMRIQRDSGNAGTTHLSIYCDLETSNSIIYAGQTVTVSFYARKGANYSGGDFAITLQTGTGTDQSQFAGFTSETTVLTVSATAASMNTSTFVRYSGSVTLASTVTQLGLRAFFTPTGTAGAADFVEVTGIQLELGSVATSFSRAGGTLAGELAACQRYYIRYTGPASYPTFASKGVSSSTTLAYFWIDHPVELRTAATSIEYATLGAYNFTPNIYALTNLVLDNCNSKVTKLAATTSGMTANHFMVLVGNNTSAAYLGINAEL